MFTYRTTNCTDMALLTSANYMKGKQKNDDSCEWYSRLFDVFCVTIADLTRFIYNSVADNLVIQNYSSRADTINAP